MLAEHFGVPQLRDLASRSEQIVDKVAVRDMSRIVALLHSAGGCGADARDTLLDVTVLFHGGMQGFPEIELRVAGRLSLCCQRCLGLLDWEVNLDSHLVVVESEADLDGIAEPFDAIVAGEHGVQLAAVIEDELLAGMPLSPMHEDKALCGAEAGMLENESEAEGRTETNRPFADLATLLDSNRK